MLGSIDQMEAERVLRQKDVVLISVAEETSEMGKVSGDSKGFAVLESNPSFPGISRLSPTPYQSPKPPSFRRRPLAGSPFCKPKSRLVEAPYPSKIKVIQENNCQTALASSPDRSPLGGSTPKENKRTAPNTPRTPDEITPKTPLMASPGGEDEEHDDDDAVYPAGYTKDQAVEEIKHGKKVKFIALIEWIAFCSIMGILIASVTINKLRDYYLGGLRIWRWCVLVLVVLCGHLVTEWFMDVLVFLIERSFGLKKKVMYFLYSLRKSVRVFIWLSLILTTWALLINRGVKRSRNTTRILNYITRGIASSLLGAAMWMMKTLFIKLLASSFHVKAFFDKIQESIYHQYVLQTLSGPSLLSFGGTSKSSGRLSFKSSKKGGAAEDVIDVDKLSKMKKEKISSWTMGGLIQVMRSSGFLTISEILDDSADDEGAEQRELASEVEAKAAAKQIFKKVAKSGNDYIEEEDLLRYMRKDEVDNVLLMFAGEGAAENGHIRKASFKSWVVKVYNERKYLVHSLNDSKTAVEELNKIASGIILVIIIIVWVLLMGFATTHVLVFISSQILLVAFMFGNTCKVVFEAIIFVFITHPFDVGDRCVVDGVQMLVEEMNILSTSFLRYDNEMIYYPNSVLATKPISNFNRSPPAMGDSVEFAVDFLTSAESIAALKAKIKAYLESKSQHWRPGHSVQIKEIEDVNKLKMALSVTHTINFQNSERSSRRSDLVLELKKIFEDLGIKYHLPPQEVLVRYVGSETQPSTAMAR